MANLKQHPPFADLKHAMISDELLSIRFLQYERCNIYSEERRCWIRQLLRWLR